MGDPAAARGRDGRNPGARRGRRARWTTSTSAGLIATACVTPAHPADRTRPAAGHRRLEGRGSGTIGGLGNPAGAVGRRPRPASRRADAGRGAPASERSAAWPNWTVAGSTRSCAHPPAQSSWCINVSIDDLPRLRARLTRPADELVLTSRRHLRSNNSWMHNVPALMRGKDRCTLLIHPDDADRAGVRSGDLAEVSTSEGSLTVTAEVSDEMMPGVVSLPHGWGHGARRHATAGRQRPSRRELESSQPGASSRRAQQYSGGQWCAVPGAEFTVRSDADGPPRICRRASTSPIPTSTPNGCRRRSSPRCAAPHRSGGTSSRRTSAGSATAASGWSASTATSARCRCAATCSRRPKKSIVPRYKVTGGGGQIEAGSASMIMMDDPEHSRLRKIISRGFTPRAVERLRAELGERAQRIAAEAAAEGVRRLRAAGRPRVAAAGDR